MGWQPDTKVEHKEKAISKELLLDALESWPEGEGKEEFREFVGMWKEGSEIVEFKHGNNNSGVMGYRIRRHSLTIEYRTGAWMA